MEDAGAEDENEPDERRDQGFFPPFYLTTSDELLPRERSVGKGGSLT